MHACDCAMQQEDDKRGKMGKWQRFVKTITIILAYRLIDQSIVTGSINRPNLLYNCVCRARAQLKASRLMHVCEQVIQMFGESDTRM
jgi:hypothetical protein